MVERVYGTSGLSADTRVVIEVFLVFGLCPEVAI